MNSRAAPVKTGSCEDISQRLTLSAASGLESWPEVLPMLRGLLLVFVAAATASLPPALLVASAFTLRRSGARESG